MKKLLMVLLGGLIIATGGFIWFNGTNAIPGNVKIILEEQTVYGKAVLFEDTDNHSFGVARLEKYLGFFYQFDGCSYENYVEKDQPFKATGYGARAQKDSFAVAVKVAENSNIAYVTIGNYMSDVLPGEKYELSLDDVKANMEQYQLKAVVDGYVLFVTDEYTEDTWTVRGFDKDGKLVAHKRFAGEPSYL